MKFVFLFLFSSITFAGSLTPDLLDFRASARAANLKVHQLTMLLGEKRALLSRAEFLLEQKLKLIEGVDDFETVELRAAVIRGRIALFSAEAAQKEAELDEKIALMRADCEAKKRPDAPKELAELYVRIQQTHLENTERQARQTELLAQQFVSRYERAKQLPAHAYSKDALNLFYVVAEEAKALVKTQQSRIEVEQRHLAEAQNDYDWIATHPPTP